MATDDKSNPAKALVFPTRLPVDEEDASFVRMVIKNISGNVLKTINMFIPSGFTLEDSANFGTMNFGTIDAVKSFSKDYGDDADAAKAKLTESKGESLAIGAAVINKLFAGAGESAMVASAKAGVVLNTKATATFEDMGVRTFSFTFKMVPEDKKDSEAMKEIEKMLREYMYPQILANVAVSYPPRFKVTFRRGSKIDNYMPLMHDAYLTGMSTTYNENSNMFYKETGAPTDVTIQLSFQETRQLTRGDIKLMEDARLKDNKEEEGDE